MLFKILLFLLLAIPAYAGLPPTRILDEGTDKGVAFKFDCVGAGITCTQSGVTGTLTVSGSGSATITGANQGTTISSTVDTVNTQTGLVADINPAGRWNVSLDPNANAATATALAANPADCGANAFATTIAANGTLTCATPALGTDTSGNYAAGDAEAGAALTGDSATAFFSTGTLEVGIGGTGAATLTDGGILLGSGTGAITALGVAANGQIPIGDGTTDPVLATITGTVNQVTVTNGAGTITLSTPQDIATTSTPTFGNLILAGAGADIRWNPTSGDSFHAGAEYNATTGTSIWLLSNVTDAKHYLVIDNAHQFEFPQYDCSTLGSEIG